jgi:glyoxylate reductase
LKVFITYKIPDEGLKLLNDFNLDINYGPGFLTRSELIRKFEDADAAVTMLSDRIDREVFENAKKLKIIANYAVGYNNIDIETAKSRGIFVTNTPGILTEATADLTFALLLSLSRRIVEADSFVREGKFDGWKPELFLGTQVHGKTIGIVGMGRIGQAVAKRACGFSMKVLYHNRRRLDKDIEKKFDAHYVDLADLMKNSDFISIHTPLTNETRHMINKEMLDLMKPASYILNMARGPIIDEKYLVGLLVNNKIAGAGFDVYENEPEVPTELMKLKNVVLLPHIGTASKETRSAMAVMACKNILEVLSGKLPDNLVPELKTKEKE